MRSCDPYKHCAALRACGTAVTQVSRNCFADIRWQWQSFGAIAFAVGNHDLAGSPIDVVKLKFCCKSRLRPMELDGDPVNVDRL